jgi:Ran GTPase-activating protein (RanGAP) involved in mRNA processing and transport
LINSLSLSVANFSNIFVGRTKEEIPQSLKLLLDAIEDKNIKELYLQDNAIGEVALLSFT